MVDPQVRESVARHVEALGLRERCAVVSMLRGGASGARVALIEVGGRPAVLKITADPSWVERAGRELLVLTQFASSLGVAVPVVIAGGRDDGVVRLLLQAEQPLRSPLADADWLRLAADLGALHRTRDTFPAGLRARDRPDRGAVDAGVAAWSRLLPEARLRRVADLLSSAMSSLPVALIHGDAHLGNVLDRAGRAVWIDWQEVGIGSGAEDLAFLWQRAEFGGVRPPRSAMIAEYAAVRGIPDDAVLARALDLAEVRLLIVDWPAFLSYGSDEGRALLTHRLTAVAARLGTE